MIDYVKSVLQSVPADMKGTAVTPATNNLFVINPTGIVLDDTKREIFVHHVMQLLYLSQRARPDIRTAIAFLCGRLNQPDHDELVDRCILCCPP